jgi:hypothetical protein
VNWDDVIQPVTDSETMYPHYYVQFWNNRTILLDTSIIMINI